MAETLIARNPMVEYLNSLRTQERGSHPTYVHEHRAAFLGQLRGDHPWFPPEAQLQVPTQLDSLVTELAQPGCGIDVVFLTGDAGDGKTTVCAALAEKLGWNEALDDITRVGGWVIVKDASEVEPDRLKELLEKHHVARTSSSDRILVAINEGRLRRLASAVYGGHPFASDVLGASLDPRLGEEEARQLGTAMRSQRVLVLNFRMRAHVRGATRGLLERWTPISLWEEQPTACGGCPARSHCSILGNIQDLRSPAIRDRAADILMAAYFSGNRLPLRRLQAVLALSCTGGLDCSDVQSGRSTGGAPADVLRYRFYDALFRADTRGPVAVRPETACRALAPLDPAGDTDRELDEEVPIRAMSSDVAGATVGGVLLQRVEQMALQGLGRSLERPEAGAQLGRITQSLRRLRAFKTDAVTASMKPWIAAVRLLEGYSTAQSDGEDLRRFVVDGLNRLHNVEGLKNDRLTRKQVDAGGFLDPSRLALELDLGTEFDTALRRVPVLPELVRRYLESCPAEILLEAWPAGADGDRAQLPIDARLLVALRSYIDGYRQIGVLGPCRRDVARFFASLLRLATRAGREPTISLLVAGTRYLVSAKDRALDIQAE